VRRHGLPGKVSCTFGVVPVEGIAGSMVVLVMMSFALMAPEAARPLGSDLAVTCSFASSPMPA
jgi:hypothetical protein